MSTKPNNNEEEVDLGSLFLIIGKGFSNLFNFIGNIFKGIFHFFILMILFFKANAIKFFIAGVIGGIFGFFLESDAEQNYSSDLLLQPNFNSAMLLYSNVSYYNNLIARRDTILLAKTFGLPTEDVASLREFEIYPIKNEKDILRSYNELIMSTDTLMALDYSFNQFKKGFNDYDYKIQNVYVKAVKANVFRDLESTIIKSILDNNYFNKAKKTGNENLTRTDALLRKNLTELDTLQKVYKKVLLAEAKKGIQGTRIDLDLGEEKKSSKELELLEAYRTINDELKEVSDDLSEKSEIVNVITSFRPVGNEIKGVQQNYIFITGVLAIMMMILFILLRRFNNYLNQYKK